MLIFKDNTIEKISFHAENEYPKECCGILLGKRLNKKRIVYRVIRTRNMIDEGENTTQFLINPFEVVKAELAAEEEQLEIVGFYHSHPDYDAVTSEADVHHMIAGYSYLVISVKNGVCAQMNSFEKITQVDTGVKEEPLIKEKKNADFGICISNFADFCKSKGRDRNRRNECPGNTAAFTRGVSGKQTSFI